LRRLEQLTREFVGDINDLLNHTVTHGVRLSSILHSEDSCVAGLGIGKTQLKPGIFRVTPSRRNPTVYMRVGYILELDQVEEFLTVTKSGFSVYADEAGEHTLFHYDYEREPANDYPNPHVQVEGQSDALDQICGRVPAATSALRDLHFPVGGRRFRPTLEDVIELLVAEHLAFRTPTGRKR
jgi:hypothetical protein